MLINSLTKLLRRPYAFCKQTNYNLEQYRNYTKSIIEATKKQQELAKLSAEGLSSPSAGRKKRKIYDRPKIDLDISKYDAWRTYDHFQLIRTNDHGLKVVGKIEISPKQFQHTFGKGLNPQHSSFSTAEYFFEDNDLSQFYLYDYRATTQYWGENLKDYDYENQENIPPKKRKTKYPTPEEFWNQETPATFRINSSAYADVRKFIDWIKKQVEESKEKESYHSRVMKQFGEIEFFNVYEKNYSDFKIEATVTKYGREFHDPKVDRSKKFCNQYQLVEKMDDSLLIHK